MDPDKRQFLRVRLDEDNLVEAEKMFDVLMGDIVEPRKRFIEDNAPQRPQPGCLKWSTDPQSAADHHELRRLRRHARQGTDPRGAATTR